jgi:hypothetical protein
VPEHQVAGFLIGDGRTDVTSPFGIESAPGLSCLWVGSRLSLATSLKPMGPSPTPHTPSRGSGHKSLPSPKRDFVVMTIETTSPIWEDRSIWHHLFVEGLRHWPCVSATSCSSVQAAAT